MSSAAPVSKMFRFLPGACAWGALAALLAAFWARPGFYAAFAAAPAVLVTVFLLSIRLLRALAPALREGEFEPGSSGYRAWVIHRGLAASARSWGIYPLIHSFYLLRFLYFRALGARIGFRVNASLDTNLRDHALVSIGNGTTISYQVRVSAHFWDGARVRISPVEIGENVFLGAYALIGPGSRVGTASWVGLRNRVIGEKLEPESKIENYAWETGSHSEPSAGTSVTNDLCFD